MSTPTSDALPIRLPRPLAHQVPIREADAARKVIRAGRRFGKSRFAMIAALDGHGPADRLGVRRFPGVLQGRDVVWVAQDYPQLSTVMWREEFLPRFKHLPYAELNQNDHFVSFTRIGLGTLYLRPETAIGGIRGIGKTLGGVILDEAAFYDLEAVLRDVLLPALLDNEGWLLLMSTTNAGHDGNAAKRVPSYFNLICEQIQRGARSAEWQEFYGTAFDNARLSPTAITELIAEYTPGSASLEQEVYARLHVAGGRYYDLAATTHLLDPDLLPTPLPSWWEYWGAYDWGFAHWAVYGVFARDPEGRSYLLDSLWLRRQQDDEQARAITAFLRELRVPGRIAVHVAGHDCWTKVTARGAPGVTTADVFAEHQLHLTRADIDRMNGGRAVRRALAIRDARASFVIVDRAPKPGELEQHGMSGNRRVYEQLAAAIPDPNDVNKPQKVDADGNGRGGDDGADMVRYGIATMVETPDAPPEDDYAPTAFAPATLKYESEQARRLTPAPAKKPRAPLYPG